MIDTRQLAKNGIRLLDMHSHTKLSDGSQTFQESINFAKKKGFGLCITDHNEIKGSLQIPKDLFTLYSSEITSSDYLDLLLYFSSQKSISEFYNKYIINNRIKEFGFKFYRTKLSTLELIEHAKDFNALTIVAHPYAPYPKKSFNFFNKNKNLIKKVDGVEGLNGMMSYKSNKLVLFWAKENNLPITAGSDAHTLKYAGSTLTACYANSKEEFIEQIRKGKSMVYSEQINSFDRHLQSTHILLKNIKLF